MVFACSVEVSFGCHRGPRGQKINFSTLVWNCSGMVKMAQKRPKEAQNMDFRPPRYYKAAPPCVHCGYRDRIFALIPSFIGSERASNGVWALARILHFFFISDLPPSLDHPLIKRHPYPINRYFECQTIAGVKKSIFPLWSGIALGWSKWPKNTPKRPKTSIFGHHGTTSVHAGCKVENRFFDPSDGLTLKITIYRIWVSL